MRLLALALTAALMAAPALAALDKPDIYDFDKQHTNILFHINHIGFSEMIGLMTSYDGSIAFDEKHPEKSSIDVNIHPSGIRTSSELLNKELQGEKWFNSSKYPDIHFVSTSVKTTGADTGEVTGNITMLGVTKPAVLHVHFNKSGYHPITNMYICGFSATTTIKRSDFGMSTGIPMVGDEVKIEIQTELVDQDRKKAEAIKH